VCTDRQNTQVSVPMMVQRSKGVLPAVGETWLVTQDLGSWTFAAIVAQSSASFQTVAQSSGVYTGATAPGTPSVGELWVNSSLGNIVTVWNGTNWEPLQFGAVAIQPGSLTGKQLAEEANIAASQVNFTASDIGGITTTISATAPSNPSFGDLWYDAENSYQLNQWSGTQWVPYQWGTQAIAARSVTTQLLAAEAVTANELAAGIVYAGIIDGTIVDAATFIGSTFEGTDFIINGAGAFFYSGTPGLGTLIASITAVATNDSYGNIVQPGVTVYNGDSFLQISVNPVAEVPAVSMRTGVASEEDVSALYTWSPNPGATAERLWSWWQGPGSTYDNKSATIILASSAADGSALASGNLVYDGDYVAAWNATGFYAATPWENMTLQNGWSLHSGSVARYRQGLDNAVYLHFTNVEPGTFSDDTVIWEIPSGLVPSNSATQNIPVAVDYTTAPTTPASTPFVAIRSNGTMTIQNLRATPASVSFVASYFLT
jgi:hypothetical protein